MMVSAINASENVLLYSDTPPGGDQYYTANIASSNLDGLPGDEIVLTDDFGAFQILSWDDENREFIERWVSDPEFELHRIKNIYLPPVSENNNAFLIFQDTFSNLHIFQWMEYMVSDIGIIHFNNAPGSELVKDFTIGEFASELTGWEIVTLRTDSLTFDKASFSYGIITTGNFQPELRQHSAVVLLNIDEESHLEIVNYLDDQMQGLLNITDKASTEGYYRIRKTYPPFDKYEEFVLPSENIEKIGWAGQIEKSGDSYLTYFTRQDDSKGQICFFILGDTPETAFEISVPSNTSKWTLGDINNNGIRELIVLDFHGIISVYNLIDAL